ncbi:hypothetical protein [Planomonospora parontospora]|uniref:hypothetical protein n=1 Tax=Planomonospora parontospora TaxID=58119 RepID=UPI00166F7EBF|nr:hypothetical protein [Planomonospora parontospora]GGL33890.1 hypothetical protein GCM10014719_38870 [Planomonospora parontospora subsp. antibiotica]GII17120.1 hypothetical protein Ppa05_38460 [Planomonospora parontospora subsp. antibiotica]
MPSITGIRMSTGSAQFFVLPPSAQFFVLPPSARTPAMMRLAWATSDQAAAPVGAPLISEASRDIDLGDIDLIRCGLRLRPVRKQDAESTGHVHRSGFPAPREDEAEFHPLTRRSASPYHPTMEIKYVTDELWAASGKVWRDDATVLLLGMSRIGISRSGRTDIYSGSFAGCMGMIVSPVDGDGGLVSHVHESGQTPGHRKEFLFEAASGALDLARRNFTLRGSGKLSLVLFRGHQRDFQGNLENPDLAAELEAAENDLEVHDIRSERDRADALFFDTREKILYLWKTILETASNDLYRKAEAFEEREQELLKAEGVLALKHAKDGGMPWRLYD